MASSKKIFSKIHNNEEFIEKIQSPRCARRISNWCFVDPEESQLFDMEIIERTRISPNKNPIINISMKSNQRCCCNSRRLNTSRQVPDKRHSIVSGRRRYSRARRKRVEWLNRKWNSGTQFLARSDEEISDDDIKKRFQDPERNYKNSGELGITPCIDRITMRRLKKVVSMFMRETSLHGIKQTWQGSPLRR